MRSIAVQPKSGKPYPNVQMQTQMACNFFNARTASGEALNDGKLAFTSECLIERRKFPADGPRRIYKKVGCSRHSYFALADAI